MRCTGVRCLGNMGRTLTMQIRSIGQIAIGCLFAISLLSACGNDGVGNNGGYVGGSCQGDRDCDEECLRGGDFPDGTCSVSCNEDYDCPSDTYCVDKEGGHCLLSCDRPADCRGGYTCKGVNNKGHSGESLVCIKN
jgi:hypothetical protein